MEVLSKEGLNTSTFFEVITVFQFLCPYVIFLNLFYLSKYFALLLYITGTSIDITLAFCSEIELFKILHR